MNKLVHPAKYSNELLPILAKYAFGHVVDIMGGTGKAGLLKKFQPSITKVTINELEPEWATQATENNVDEIIVGDAAKLKINCDVIVTSPPYGNRLADNFKSSKPRPKTMAYALDLKRDPSEGSVCCKHFGRGYEDLMARIYDSVFENCRFKRFVLNVSNFICNWQEIDVVAWYKNYFRERERFLSSSRRIRCYAEA